MISCITVRTTLWVSIQEGRAEGREEAYLAIARNMKQLGVPTDVIVNATGPDDASYRLFVLGHNYACYTLPQQLTSFLGIPIFFPC